MSIAVPVEKKKTAARVDGHGNGDKRFKNNGVRPTRATRAIRKPAIPPEPTVAAANSTDTTILAGPAPVIEKVLNPGEKRQVSFAQMLVFELRVRDAMTSPPITATPADTLRSIQLLMKAHRISGVPILANDVLVGIISIEDIINALDGGHINDPVEQWMSRKIVTLRDHFSLVRAVAEFDRHGYGRFPVLDANSRLVGIITRGDITVCLMHHLERRAEEAMAKEAALVATRAADEKAHRTVINTDVKSGDFESAGKLSQRMREVLRARGIAPDVLRRAAIIAYEAETNIIIHSLGGRITTTIDSRKVRIKAVDSGPGIENIDLAMQEGWSTAGPLARELGFGAGMGLPNIKRCADEFAIQSELGSGTRLLATVLLPKAGITL
jgi:CBS domain-containing protein/anti-sigma regulatory factor (Ser/Thr protein kinase)